MESYPSPTSAMELFRSSRMAEPDADAAHPQPGTTKISQVTIGAMTTIEKPHTMSCLKTLSRCSSGEFATTRAPEVENGPAGPSLGADTDRVLAEFAGSTGTGTANACTVTEEVRS
jgi:hypothetical protein